MTTLFMDGFDHYGTGAQSTAQLQDGPYSNAGNRICGFPSWGPARTGNSCLVGSGIFEANTTRVLPAAQTNLFVSFGWAIDILSGPNLAAIIGFSDSSGSLKAYLQPTDTGALNLYRSDGTLLAGTSGPVIVTQNWHFFELNLNTSTGVFTLRVDDASATNTPVLTITDTSLTGWSIGILDLLYAPGNNTIQVYMDDLFVRNASGSVNNSWLGDRRVATLFPDADTTTAGWTPSYYQKFGTGIYRGPYLLASNSTIQNSTANIAVHPAASLDIGANDFTLETWIRFDALPQPTAYASIFSRWDSSTNHESYRFILGGSSFNNGCLQFDTSTDGTSGTQQTMLTYPWTPETNVWYFLTLCRTAGELLLFVNGEQLGLPIADSRTYFSGGPEYFGISQEFTYGNTSPIANTFLAARLDETRFTNGVGRYTASFTPPTAAFPRGSSDPYWADVVLLMGYDVAIVDESSFAQNLSGQSGAVAFQVNDGSNIGAFSTIDKPTPDDNTFISANFLDASNVLTMTTQPSNTQTVTVGTTNGTTPAVYTFKTSISTAFDVLIDTTAQGTLTNLLNAINAGAGSGTKYGTGTTSNFDVNASALPAGQIAVTANVAGTGGNSIASTSTASAAVWATSTLTGGTNIPGPSNFVLSRPPNNTTIISAVQNVVRALKTDSGTATMQTSLVGALGGLATSSTYSLTTSPTYYQDVIELDPDTSGPISPTTIINGKVQVNRIT